MKKLLRNLSLCLLAGSLFVACSPPPEPAPEPEPEEYFSFYADGEYFDYPQIKGLGFDGTGQTLQASKIGSTQYKIYAYDLAATPARGAFSIYFAGAHIPDQDTVLLTSVGIQDFKNMGNGYEIHPPLTGKIIFTERTLEKLTGTFEFEAYKVYKDISGTTLTDTIITITNGKFSIIPSN